jgi:AraC family transcriptional regulator, regulatory protein of adaptative response / methylated-DNA-[protein]-cysteine methyltransferase
MIYPFIKEDFKNHTLQYWYEESPIGRILLASTKIGICSASPSPNKTLALNALLRRFEGAVMEQAESRSVFQLGERLDAANSPFDFHLTGTPFQLKVWNALLQIPFGETSTYGKIALEIGNPKASRAVGCAVGNNPVFYLIPCHRVLPATGKIGNYLWGSGMKQELLNLESIIKR